MVDKKLTLEQAESRIKELEAALAAEKRLREMAAENFDPSGTTQWTGLNQDESGRLSSQKQRRRFLSTEEFMARDRDWLDRGMPGPQDQNAHRAEIREFDAETGKEINADPRLAPREVAPARKGVTVDETGKGE